MKNNKKYFVLSLIAVLAVAGATLGTLSFAQTVTPLTCSVGAGSVGVNQSMVLTAIGGNGTYAWSGPNLSVTNNAGSQFSVSYSEPGVYPITVTSGGQDATCNVNVIPAGSSGALSCFPQTQNVILGQTASLTATGGDGVNYTWSSPDLNITNAQGSGFSANYASIGMKTLTVSSAGLTTSCVVNVLAATTAPAPVTPGLPDTGGGYWAVLQ